MEGPLQFVDNDKHRSNLTFMLSTWFQKPIKLRSSSTCFYPASLCEGSIFYFMLSQFTYFFLSPKQTLVSTVCNNSYMLTYCTCYISLCWQLSMWYTCSKLKGNAETFLCVASMPFYLETIALWVNSYANLFYACLKVLSVKTFYSYDVVVYSLSIC